jgi:hypothetical protein
MGTRLMEKKKAKVCLDINRPSHGKDLRRCSRVYEGFSKLCFIGNRHAANFARR